MQVEGIFDLPPGEWSESSWDVELPLEDRAWSIGLIVGPSGCGKSTIARYLWPDLIAEPTWPLDQSVLDGFPTAMPIKEIVALLSSVGFSSPPAWLRPYHVLSTGERFRVDLARKLAEIGASAPASGGATSPPCGDGSPHLVIDEFTSVVDRTVARIGSAAFARTVRQLGHRVVCVTCHEDVEAWLDPDWCLRPATNEFAWRSLRGRPEVSLRICRVPSAAWALFRRHHYLDTNLNAGAWCFGAWWQDRLVAFSAWLPLMTSYAARREHRTVCLPDYQGVGIGQALSGTIAALWRGLGYRAYSTTSHPAMIAHRARSPLWRMHRPPGRTSIGGKAWKDAGHQRSGANDRYTAGFEYVGPALQTRQAEELFACQSIVA